MLALTIIKIYNLQNEKWKKKKYYIVNIIN